MGKRVINIDEHNKLAVRSALRRRGGQATVNNIGLYFSDEQTLQVAAKRVGVVVSGKCLALRGEAR
jgi:hypothetical protein